MAEPRPGAMVGGYDVVSVLGSGGMATVYLVRHHTIGTEFALKVLHVTSRQIRSRLLQEGQVQATLRHPNIVGVHDVLLVGDQPALLMDYVDGPDLDTAIQAGRASQYPLPRIDALARGIVAGVETAHRAGILHRDLKPSNVLLASVGDDLVPRISDFGLAKIVGSGGTSTKTGQLFGTPCYMAPEQFRDAKAVDARADLFSLGCLLYELVSGRRAFPGNDLFDLHRRICAGEFEPLSRAGVPARMVEAIEGALAPDPDRRIADCDTFLSVWDGRAHTFDGVALDFTDSESPTVMVDVYAEEALTVVYQAATEVLEPPPPRTSWVGWVSAGVAALTAVTVPLGLMGLAAGVVGVVLLLRGTATGEAAAALVLPGSVPVAMPVGKVPVEPEAPVRVRPPAPAPPPGRLTVTIESGGLGWANVSLDGQDVGKRAPFGALEVPAGVHRLRIDNPYADGPLVDREIEVSSGETTVVPVQF